MFFEDPRMDFVSGSIIRAMGENFPPPIHPIFRSQPDGPKGRNDTYFLRRLHEYQRTGQLKKYLPRLLKDARDGFKNLRRTAAGVTKPADDCYRIVWTQDCRLLCSDEIVDNPKLLDALSTYARYLLHTCSNWNVLFLWLPSPSWAMRRITRYRFYSLLRTLIKKRMKGETPEWTILCKSR